MKPSLSIVSKAAPVKMPPYDSARGRKRMQILRDQLLHAAARYVKDGADGTRADRLRTATSLSGIPVTLIEVAAK